MRQSLLTLLALLTLLSQWSWQAHAYHDHDHDEPGHICELCVSAASHVAITPSVVLPPVQRGSHFAVPAVHATHKTVAPRYYSVRAPPRFL